MGINIQEIAINIRLGEKSKQLIRALGLTSIGIPAISVAQLPEEIDLRVLSAWLTATDQPKARSNYQMECLYRALLEDIRDGLETKPQPVKQQAPASWLHNLNPIILTSACVLFFGSEGFDGLFAMLGLFSHPALVFFLAGIVYSTVSVFILYLGHMQEMANVLDISVTELPAMLETYLDELALIKAIRKQISSRKSLTNGDDEQVLIALLMHRFQSLTESRKELALIQNNDSSLSAAKTIVSLITGIIFFNSGYFAGETLAIELGQLIFGSMAAGSWPVILTSLIVGLAAFSVYWIVERPDMEDLISRWFGMDQSKITQLCDETSMEKQNQKLVEVKHTVETLSKNPYGFYSHIVPPNTNLQQPLLSMSVQ